MMQNGGRPKFDRPRMLACPALFVPASIRKTGVALDGGLAGVATRVVFGVATDGIGVVKLGKPGTDGTFPSLRAACPSEAEDSPLPSIRPTRLRKSILEY
jgi:hypothetical protein